MGWSKSDYEEIEIFVSGLQTITQENIEYMNLDKIAELIGKAAHIIIKLKIELEYHQPAIEADKESSEYSSAGLRTDWPR